MFILIKYFLTKIGEITLPLLEFFILVKSLTVIMIMLMLGPNFSFTKHPILTIPGMLLLTKIISEGFFPSGFLDGGCISDLSLIFFSLNLLKVSLFLRTILRLMLMVPNFSHSPFCQKIQNSLDSKMAICHCKRQARKTMVY
jgi:hypothetical protein